MHSPLTVYIYKYVKPMGEREGKSVQVCTVLSPYGCILFSRQVPCGRSRDISHQPFPSLPDEDPMGLKRCLF